LKERERERENKKKKPTMDTSIITKVDTQSKNVITPVAATGGRKKQPAMSEIQTGNSMEGEEDDKDAKSENSSVVSHSTVGQADIEEMVCSINNNDKNRYTHKKNHWLMYTDSQINVSSFFS
jgi:hypothetical protein